MILQLQIQFVEQQFQLSCICRCFTELIKSDILIANASVTKACFIVSNKFYIGVGRGGGGGGGAGGPGKNHKCTKLKRKIIINVTLI